MKFVEAHAQPTNQVKNFLLSLIENTYQNDCSFLRTLEKVNDFAVGHKILHVSKVTLCSDRVVSRESNKLTSHNFFQSQQINPDNLKSIRSNLQKLVAPTILQSKSPSKMGMMQQYPNKSTANLITEHSLMHSPSYTNLNHPTNHNNFHYYNPFSPNTLNFTQKQGLR